MGLPPTASFFLSNLDIWMHHDHLLGGADTTSPGTADAPEKARSPVPNLVSFMSTKIQCHYYGTMIMEGPTN